MIIVLVTMKRKNDYYNCTLLCAGIMTVTITDSVLFIL